MRFAFDRNPIVRRYRFDHPLRRSRLELDKLFEEAAIERRPVQRALQSRCDVEAIDTGEEAARIGQTGGLNGDRRKRRLADQ